MIRSGRIAITVERSPLRSPARFAPRAWAMVERARCEIHDDGRGWDTTTCPACLSVLCLYGIRMDGRCGYCQTDDDESERVTCDV